MASEFQTRVTLVVCPSLSGIPPVVISVFAMSGEWAWYVMYLWGPFSLRTSPWELLSCGPHCAVTLPGGNPLSCPQEETEVMVLLKSFEDDSSQV